MCRSRHPDLDTTNATYTELYNDNVVWLTNYRSICRFCPNLTGAKVIPSFAQKIASVFSVFWYFLSLFCISHKHTGICLTLQLSSFVQIRVIMRNFRRKFVLWNLFHANMNFSHCGDKSLRTTKFGQKSRTTKFAAPVQCTVVMMDLNYTEDIMHNA